MATQKEKSIYQILTEFIHQAHRGDLKTGEYPRQWSDWNMKVSFGMGGPARVPWIALTTPDMSVSDGYYPVYLYYKDLKILILAFGVSETKQHKDSWPQSILNKHPTIEKQLGKVYRYGDSMVFKQYRTKPESKRSLDIDAKSIDKDLRDILNTYQNSTNQILSNPSSHLSQSIFYLESQLEDFLIQNWQHTKLAKNMDLIYDEDGEIKSKQYRTEIGQIDILARNKYNKSHTVIELKRNQTSDDTVGQVARYMGWVKNNLCDPRVEGLIIAKNIDKKLRYAIDGVDTDNKISLWTYNIDFQLNNC